MGSKVPKFGAWEGGENFTVYFDNARKTKNNGQKINPNDPDENPDLFGGSGQAPAQAGPSQTRADEQRKARYGGPSAAENEPQAQARPLTAKVPQLGPTPQEGRAKVPQFGAWNGGEGTQYTAYFDNARKTKNVVDEPMMNRDVADRARAPPATKVRAESSKDDVPRNASRGSTSSEGLGKQSSVPKTPVHLKGNVQPRTGGGRGNQAASIPQYGGWNNDPSQAEGYTVAFARAKEERKTPLNNNVPPTYYQQPQYNNPKQASCCSIL